MEQQTDQHRRDFLKVAAATLGSTVPLMRTHAAPTALTDLSASDAVTAMRKGEFTAEAYAKALLDRAARTRALNAFITIDAEAVLHAAREADLRRRSGASLGPLHGLPMPVKDSVNTKDLPTTSGTAALNAFRPKEDAPIVRALRDAGAIVLGKTNLHELSYGWTSNNAFTGAVHNPYDPERIPGGSSGGSGAAVSARVAPLAVAEDTFGSIRVPAAMCGIAGLRPSFGRYSNAGVMPVAPKHLDAVGPVARTVSDLALFNSVITGDFTTLQPKPLAGVRIGIASDYFFEDLHPDVLQVTERAIRKLQEHGAILVWADIPEIAKSAMEHGFNVVSRNSVPSIKEYLASNSTGVEFDAVLKSMSKDVREVFEAFALPGGPEYASDEAYSHSVAQLPQIRLAMTEHFRQHAIDALMFPTCLVPPPRIGEEEVDTPGGKKPIWYVMARNIAVGSAGGLPGLVLPGGLTPSGLPVGIEFDAVPGSDRQLLALGVNLQRALGDVPRPKV